MASSLIPERPLLISPTLAATIGLEEAVMLHVLSELQLQHAVSYREQRCWCELDQDMLAEAMPFWDLSDIKRVQRNLQEKGLILMASGGQPGSFCLAINQVQEPGRRHSASQVPAAPLPRPAAVPGAHPGPGSAQRIFETASSGQVSYIPANWQPAEELYLQCQQHNIPRDFIEQRVRSFVMYQRERRKTQYSWHHAFLKYIIREWRNEQSYRGAKELESNMSAGWRPSEDAATILEHAGISHSFIEDSVPEFVLYWRERGLVTSTWNTRFIAHVRRQWAKFTSMEQDNTPRPIPTDFQPSPTCFEVLALANIDQDFALGQIKEFVLYWQDRGDACVSWNTRFLQHVKYKWANQHQSNLPADQQMENTIERMTDRSWAD